jgi:hypothetical protein
MDTIYAAFRALPERSASPVPQGFPDASRGLPAWIDALPRANAQLTQQALQQALDAMASRPWRGAERWQALELLQPVVQQVLGQRLGQLKQAALPLPPAAAQAARAIEALHLALAQGYRQAVAEWCAPAGRLPLLKGGKVGEALYRAMEHYSRALALAWRVYRAPLPDVWQSLHRTVAFAEAVKLDRKPVEDATAGRSSSIRQRYLQCLLVALANPYALSQAEQDALWQLALDYGPRLPVQAQRPSGAAAAWVPDVDAAAPRAAEAEAHRQWLDAEPLLADLQAALGGSDAATVLLSYGGAAMAVERELATRLLQTLSAGVARGQPRYEGAHTLDTVMGLSAVHFHLAGGLTFDAFVRQARGQEVVIRDRAAWAQGSTDASWAQTLPARVLDQSRTGYGLVWEPEAQARIRVGELVAVSLHDEVIEPRAWLLGLIRWLRYEDDGRVSAGVELIALHARAVAMQALARTAAVADAVRAIEFIGINGHPAHGFVASTVAVTQRPRQQILRVDDERKLAVDRGVAASDMLDLQVISSTGEYRLLAAAAQAEQGKEQTA